MSIEGTAGIAASLSARSTSLTSWALSSAVETLASIIVIWRFTGTRTLSDLAETRAQKPSRSPSGCSRLTWRSRPVTTWPSASTPGTSVPGIAVTAASVVIMPVLGTAKRRLATRLNSGAIAGEGTQNLLCAYLAAAVLTGLAASTLIGWWHLDPLIGIAAATTISQGRRSWRDSNCQC